MHRSACYDALGRLSAVLDAASETTIAVYAYDFLNRRTFATDASGTVYFHYDGASANVIAETDGAGATIASYAYDAQGRIHSMSRAGATYYYHTNGHGDVVAVTNAAGEVANTYRYDPWGRVLEANETAPNPYRYASYRYDEATGLYYLWNRYYSPGECRFLTRDLHPGRLESPSTLNPYLYCYANPVSAVDPTGLAAWAWWPYAFDSLLFIGTVGYTLLLGLGVIYLNPGLILFGQLTKLGVLGFDAVADANWDAHTGGCRSQGNADAGSWHMAKTANGAPDPVTGALLDLWRGLTSAIGNAVQELFDDADYLFV